MYSHNVVENSPANPALARYFQTMADEGHALAQNPYRPYHRPNPQAAVAGQPATIPIPRLAPFQADTTAAHNLGRQQNIMAPYIARAQEFTNRGTQEFPEHLQRYMNPYQDRVVNSISELGNRNFNENTLPALEAQFVSNGAFGGGRHREMALRAARDSNESIGREQGRALAAGYSQAGTLYGQDRARQMEAAGQSGDLGKLAEFQRLSNISSLEAQGRLQQEQAQNSLNMEHDAFLREQQHPWDMLARKNAIFQGIPMQTNSASYNNTPSAPQMNGWGNAGSAAMQILGASMMGGRGGFKLGGGVKISRRLMKQIGI